MEQRRKQKAIDRESGFGQRDSAAGWKFGIIYFSPTDQRVWVPRRRGMKYGQTLNFGNPRSWLTLALLLLPVFVAVCLVLWAARLD